MENLFATKEIASKLKDLDFDENCFGYYSNESIYVTPNPRTTTVGGLNTIRNTSLYFSVSDGKCMLIPNEDAFAEDLLANPDHFLRLKRGFQIAAPTWQQVFDWFREVHNLHITPLNVWEMEGDIDYRTVKPTGWIIDMFMYDGNYSQDQAKIYKTFDEAKVACVEKMIELIENE